MLGTKLKGGLNVTRESWQVLRTDRKLLLFPLLSGLAGMAVLATILCAGISIPEFGRWALGMMNKKQPHSLSEQVLGILCLFAVYYVEWFVVVFFNTALVGCALMRFSGGDPTVKDGFRLAVARLPQILAWTFVVAAVGTLLSAIERRFSALGKIIVRLVGLTWAVATYFVVPILAAEGTGPITSVRRSIGLLKKSWGEGLSGNFVISVASLVVALPIIAAAIVGIVVAALLNSVALMVLTVAVVMIAIMLITIVSSAMRQIFLAGLYCYATTGEVPSGFSEDSLRQALKSK